MNKSLAKIVTIAAVVLLGAVTAPVLAKEPAMAAADELPIRGPWLREHLPEDVLVYTRIPHPFGLFGTPKGNALDAALRSSANAAAISGIRRGISENVLPRLPIFQDPLLLGLEKHLQSPTEFAILAGQAPSLLVAFNLGIDSRQSFESLLGMTDGQRPGLAGPLDADGVGQLVGTGVPAFLRYDEASGQVVVNVGPAVTPESFASLVVTLARNDDHDMLAMERRIDESGQGLFSWINAAKAIPMAQLMMQPEQFEQLAAAGLDKVSAAAWGWGVANGKGRLAVVADVPLESNRGFLPFVSNRVTATSVGEPDGLLLLSVPTAEEFRRLESKVLAASDAVTRAQWAEVKTSMAIQFGFSLENVFDALGPELLIVFDRAGDYSAVRLRDAAAWERIISGVLDGTDATYETRRVGRQTYHHFSVASATDFGEAEGVLAEKAPWLADLLALQREHAYWVQDGDFLYFASVPQVLIDRDALRARTNIGDWLRDRQRIDVSEAVLSISGTSEKLPGRLYAMYVEILQFLADIAQADFDVWSMPTAAQLGLPRDGTVGFALSLGNPTLAVELTFENNPAEAFGSLGGVAMAGILAAIAIPAYQDYTIRAKVAEGLNVSGGAKVAVTEHYMDHGAFPGEGAAGNMSILNDAGKYTEAVIVEPGTGVITIHFREDAVPGDGRIFLAPNVRGDDALEWTCTSTLAAKHVPAACRGGE